MRRYTYQEELDTLMEHETKLKAKMKEMEADQGKEYAYTYSQLQYWLMEVQQKMLHWHEKVLEEKE